MSAIKDINLAPSGAHKIDWVRKNCPLLRSLEDDFSKERPFEGIRIALSIHLEQPVAMPDESAYQERFEKRVTGTGRECRADAL